MCLDNVAKCLTKPEIEPKKIVEGKRQKLGQIYRVQYAENALIRFAIELTNWVLECHRGTKPCKGLNWVKEFATPDNALKELNKR